MASTAQTDAKTVHRVGELAERFNVNEDELEAMREEMEGGDSGLFG